MFDHCTINQSINRSLTAIHPKNKSDRDRKEASLYLKPAPREERRRVHLLAEFYGLKSVSYDNDPKRFVALIKAPGACVDRHAHV